MVVVSAGIKDNIDTVFHEMLRGLNGEYKVSYDELRALYNLSVVANTFKYENRFNPSSKRMERTVIDYDRRVLHSMNKCEFINEIYKEELQN